MLASLCVASIASGEIITLTSAGDGYYNRVNPNIYSGYYDTDTTNPVSYSFWGTSDSLQINTSYVEFNISSLAGRTVMDATLNIYLTGAYFTGSTTSAGTIDHVSNSSGANGSASQRLGGDQLVYTVISDPVGWLTVDITAMLQNDINNGYSYCCFSFDPNTTGDYSNRNAGFSFASADAASNQPYLVVPEPASTAALFGTALLPLMYLRRRWIKA